MDYAKQSECAHTLSKTPPHSPLHDLNVHNASNQRKIFALHIKNPATVLAKPLNYLIHARVCERDVKNVLKGGCRSVEVNSEKKILFPRNSLLNFTYECGLNGLEGMRLQILSLFYLHLAHGFSFVYASKIQFREIIFLKRSQQTLTVVNLYC